MLVECQVNVKSQSELDIALVDVKLVKASLRLGLNLGLFRFG